MFFKKHVLDSTKQVCCVRPFLVVRAAARWPLAPTAGGCFGGVFAGRVGRDGGHLRGHGRGFGAFWVCWLLGERHSRCSVRNLHRLAHFAVARWSLARQWIVIFWRLLLGCEGCGAAKRSAGCPLPFSGMSNQGTSGGGSTLLRDRIDLPEAFKWLRGGKNPSNSTRTQLCCSWCS